MVKTVEQINSMRKSSSLASSCLDFIYPYIVPGCTTKYLNDLIEEYIRSNGGIPASLNYKGFPAATCMSINEVVCHGIPDDTVLKDGDIVGVDVATILNGYYGDTCYTFPVGNISEKTRKLLQIAKNATYIGINQVKEGNYTGNIGYEINKYIERNGYSVCTSFTGHEIFEEYHGNMTIHHAAEKNTGEVMKEGMIFTIEPIINLGKPDVTFNGWIAKSTDGRISAQFEHTILVKKGGYEILTSSDIWNKIIF